MERPKLDDRISGRRRVLLVEDDQGLAELLTWHLDREGFDLVHTNEGEEALRLARRNPPDLVLLDWMIEGLTGIQVCRQLRSAPGLASTPIIMISGRSEEADRISGLDCGADDYLVKPFSPRELIARVTALMRRSGAPATPEALRFADLELDLVRHRASRGGQAIPLGPTEFRLLHYLMERPYQVFSRERLLGAVWGRDRAIESRTVDVHVRRLRQAICSGDRPDLIRTVRQAGYSLDDDPI